MAKLLDWLIGNKPLPLPDLSQEKAAFDRLVRDPSVAVARREQAKTVRRLGVELELAKRESLTVRRRH